MGGSMVEIEFPGTRLLLTFGQASFIRMFPYKKGNSNHLMEMPEF